MHEYMNIRNNYFSSIGALLSLMFSLLLFPGGRRCCRPCYTSFWVPINNSHQLVPVWPFLKPYRCITEQEQKWHSRWKVLKCKRTRMGHHLQNSCCFWRWWDRRNWGPCGLVMWCCFVVFFYLIALVPPAGSDHAWFLYVLFSLSYIR